MHVDNYEVAFVARALAICVDAHAGTVDKVGAPYVEHPQRVAARLTDPIEVAAAFLHDVLEDCPEWSAQRLIDEGIPVEVVKIVELLTHRPDTSRETYLRRLAHDEHAYNVKLADLAENTSPDRRAVLASVDPATAQRLQQKYDHTRQILIDERRQIALRRSRQGD